MSKKTTVKKSVSFREDVFKEAEKMADMYFGGNFSAYITYLVCADKHGLTRMQQTEETVETKEEIKENVKKFEKSDEADDYINSILSI